MRPAVGIALFPFVCIFISLFALITDPAFTYLLLQKTSPQESIPVTYELFSYFARSGTMPQVFDASERSHLSDVRRLIWIAAATLIVILFFFIKSIDRKDAQLIIRGGTIFLLVMVIWEAISPFDNLFQEFHRIFFPQGNWTFPATSALITFYPFQFFMSYASAIGVYALALALVANLFVWKK